MSGPDVSEDDEGSPRAFPASWSERSSAADASDVADWAEFEAYYRRFVPTLVGFLICQGASVHLAADIAQDTMIKIWRRWPQLRHPEAYARRTAVRDLIRYLIGDKEMPTDPIPPTLLPPDCDTVGEFEASHVTMGYLRRLPDRQRQVMAWTLDGFAPTEIARELGTTPEAVRSSLKIARRKIVEMLDEEQL